MALEDLTLQNENEITQQAILQDVANFLGGGKEKLPQYETIEKFFSMYTMMFYDFQLRNKYEGDYVDILGLGNFQEHISKQEIVDLLGENQYTVYEDLGLSDAVFILSNVIAKRYIERYNRRISEDGVALLAPEGKKDIIDKIHALFGSVEKTMRKENAKDNADVFSLFVIASLISGKKMSYKNIKNLYSNTLKGQTQDDIAIRLGTKFTAENRHRARLEKVIADKKLGIQEKQLLLSTEKEVFYDTMQAVKQLESSIEKTIVAIKDLEQQKKALENRPQTAQEETDKIKKEIQAIEQSIKQKQRELKVLEQQKGFEQQGGMLNRIDFSWYNPVLSEIEKTKISQKQKLQYWLDMYGQKDPAFTAETVLAAIANVESAINGGGECTKTDFNERLQSKYNQALLKLKDRENNSDYKVSVSVDYVMAFMFLESHFGKSDRSRENKNPGNVKSDAFGSWQDGIEACAFNIAARILSYQEQFGADRFPTVKELYENKSESDIGFVIGTENRGDENGYRSGNIIKDGEPTTGRLNPEGAYMPGYPGGSYVLSCYEKVMNMNKLYDASLSIYQQEQELEKEGLSDTKKTEIQKNIEALKLTKKNLENKLSELQKKELSLDNISTDIDALGEQYAKELADAYAKQKEYEEKKTTFTAQSKDLLGKITELNVQIDALLADIQELDETKRKMAIIQVEKNSAIPDEEYSLDADTYQKIRDDTNGLYDDVNKQISTMDKKFVLPVLEVKPSKEVLKLRYDVSCDLSYVKVEVSQEELDYNQRVENAAPKKGLQSFKAYKESKAYHESRGNWKIYNRFGFMGKYQMGETELRGVGYGHIKFRNFKKDPNILPEADQEIAYMRLQRLNKYFMRTHYHLIGQTIGGVYITEGVLVGGAGIGVGNVKNFLDHGIDKKDGFGKKTSYVMKLFQNFDVSGIVPMTYQEWQKLRKSHLKKKVE